MQLTEEFKKALWGMQYTKQNIFISGKAGTGKSSLIQLFLKQNNKLRAKNVGLVAPTGLAAFNIGGSTIHSFFNFPAIFLGRDIIFSTRKQTTLKALDMLIIDEVSMVRVDLMDAIDKSLRKNRAIDKPFGGVQMIFIGDLLQLPPVVPKKDEEALFSIYQNEFFFSAPVFQTLEFSFLELTTVFRQTEDEGKFKNALNTIRIGEYSTEDLSFINNRTMPLNRTIIYPLKWWKRVFNYLGKKFSIVFFTPQKEEVKLFADNEELRISPNNKLVFNINQKRLRELPGETSEFKALLGGEILIKSITQKWFEKSLEEQGKLETPFPITLQLKKNAKIVMLNNDKFKRWVNGTRGIILEIGKDKEGIFLYIKLPNSIETIRPERVEEKNIFFENGEEKEIIISSFVQFPLKLAWAITIHKSQGMTLDQCVVANTGGKMFETGQLYVALSRVKSISGLFLERPIMSEEILINKIVLDFYKNLNAKKTSLFLQK